MQLLSNSDYVCDSAHSGGVWMVYTKYHEEQNNIKNKYKSVRFCGSHL